MTMTRGDKKQWQPEPTNEFQANSYQDTQMTLKWSYNYFSLDPDESFNNWQEKLPLTIKDALYDEEG
jgi:hypothetical protein